MLSTLSLIRREFSAYFLSPIAYVVLTVFLFVTGYRFYMTLEQLTFSGPRGAEFPMQYFLLGDRERIDLGAAAFWGIYLFIPPLLTMRLFAEERGTGTLEMLMTAPLRDWQVVLSKYVACFAFYLVLWLPTLVYLPILLNLHFDWSGVWTLYSGLMVGGAAAVLLGLVLTILPTGTVGRILGLILLVPGLVCAGVGGWGTYTQDAAPFVLITPGIDPMPVLATYLGLTLAGAMFLALGLWISSLVRSQLVAALLALVASMAFIVTGVGRLVPNAGDLFYRVLSFFSVPLHISDDFSRGIVDTRHLVLYGSAAVFFLFLTIRSLESRRWR